MSGGLQIERIQELMRCLRLGRSVEQLPALLEAAPDTSSPTVTFSRSCWPWRSRASTSGTRRCVWPYPLREKLPLLPEPIVQDELTTDEREAFLGSFDNDARFRVHFTVTTLAKRTDRKHQPPNAQNDYVTYAFERVQWSKPLFVMALCTALRRSDLRLLK